MKRPSVPTFASPGSVEVLWSRPMRHGPRGLALAREKGWILTWDEQHWLYLLNHAGEIQAQRHIEGGLVTACAADDGSAYVALGAQGEVVWLAPDLMPRWECTLPARGGAVALDSLGQYVAVADIKGNLHVFDRLGKAVCQIEGPRQLHHLAFVPGAAAIIGASDYGLVAAFDLTGQLLWRDGLVAHIGSLTLTGDGERILCACFTEGLVSYNLAGKKLGRVEVSAPCRLASLSFDGRLTLVAWLTNQLVILDADGRNLCTYPLDKPIVALALSALGGTAYVALGDGPTLGLDLRSF